MRRRRIAWVCLVALLAAGCGRREEPAGEMEAAAFWVWHRGSALAKREVADLEKAGTRLLGWQVAEIGWEDGEWRGARISGPREPVEGVEIFPVLRLLPDADFLEDGRAAGALARWWREWAGPGALPAEVQLDFDCPGRLLGRYGDFVRDLKRELGGGRVSVTALASWIGEPGFRRLAREAAWVAPMFYDMEGDAAVAVAEGNFRPMADGEGLAWVRRWRSCRAPWRAGLPNFERVSVFTAEGELRGHLRGWSHDALWFHPDLVAEDLGAGVTVFRAGRAVEVAGTRVSPEDFLVHRMPEERALREMEEAAREAGAVSVIWFALPGPGLQAAYSARHLAAVGSGAELALEAGAGGVVVLRNVGEVDLPARPGGWELRLAAERAGALRSAGPGGFAAVLVEGGLPAEAAAGLGLRFSRLPAGAAIMSGPLVEKPESLRWRVEGAGEVWMMMTPDGK